MLTIDSWTLRFLATNSVGKEQLGGRYGRHILVNASHCPEQQGVALNKIFNVKLTITNCGHSHSQDF